jgi:GTP cyclohydrolase I
MARNGVAARGSDLFTETHELTDVQRRVPILDPETSVREAVTTILASVGEDPERDGLRDTPARVARMYADLLEGYQQNLEQVVNGARFEVVYGDGEMILATGIRFESMCEHHMLPFTGVAHVAYVPTDRVIGLSKIPRIVDMFAHRLQIQERLTNEIADGLADSIGAAGVMVIVEGEHSCASLRGVKKHGLIMTTTAQRGSFRTDRGLRDEFYRLLGR